MVIKKHAIIQWFMVSIFVVLFVWAQAVADARSEAKAALELVINKVVAIIKQPGFTQRDNRQALLGQAEIEIKSIFDFEEFSARTLGSAWKSFNPEQKIKFNEAFATLLRNTYLDQIDNYNGEPINYLGEITSSKGDRVEVQTSIIVGNKNVLINYLTLKKPEGWKIYDIVAEGVSMVQNYRSQFKEIIQKDSNPDELIIKVAEKAESIRIANDKKNIRP